MSSSPVAALPDCPSSFLSLWKQAFSVRNANVQSLREGLMPIYEKSPAFLLCFLVAGPRIELGTSWLWIMRSNQLSYPAMLWALKFCWDRRTRTLTDRARICSATITPYLNLASLWFWDCKCTDVLRKSKNILKKLLKNMKLLPKVVCREAKTWSEFG